MKKIHIEQEIIDFGRFKAFAVIKEENGKDYLLKPGGWVDLGLNYISDLGGTFEFRCRLDKEEHKMIAQAFMNALWESGYRPTGEVK